MNEARRILHAGAEINVRDKFGDTALIVAIRDGLTDFAQEVLAAGADPNFAGGARDTPLVVAAWYGDLKIAKILLGRGVPVDGANYHDETALMAASQTCVDGKMVQLLLDAGADPNLRSNLGSTALMDAADNGNVLVIKQLLKAGADPTMKDDFKHTAADSACGRDDSNHRQVCALLQEAFKKK